MSYLTRVCTRAVWDIYVYDNCTFKSPTETGTLAAVRAKIVTLQPTCQAIGGQRTAAPAKLVRKPTKAEAQAAIDVIVRVHNGRRRTTFRTPHEVSIDVEAGRIKMDND